MVISRPDIYKLYVNLTNNKKKTYKAIVFSYRYKAVPFS